MLSRAIRRTALGALWVLAALMIGAALLYAAGEWQPAAATPQLEASAAGSLELTNSRAEGAILDLDNLAPGITGQGEVTIGNAGTAPGTLALTAADLGDSPGRYGGTLSDRLLLRIEQLGPTTTEEVYSGQLGAMPELSLGTLAAGESRTYRLLVTMLDGGAPASPFVEDNVYQRATTSVGYQWTLTESEGGAPNPEPPPKPPAEPPPPSTAPPASPPPPGETQLADRLIGTEANDVIRGLGGADRLYGEGGRDRLFGGPGADWLFGGAGNDRLLGGAGRDHLLGGAGADAIFARGGGKDLVNCGSGRDTVHVDPLDRARNCEVERS